MSNPIKININGNQIKFLTDYYMKHLSSLKDRKKEIELDISDVEDIIKQLSNQPIYKAIQTHEEIKPQNNFNNDNNNFSLNWPIHKKIAYVLEQSTKPMPTREIIEKLMDLDSTMHANKAKASKNISTVLSIKTGVIFQRQKENNENIYSMKK